MFLLILNVLQIGSTPSVGNPVFSVKTFFSTMVPKSSGGEFKIGAYDDEAKIFIFNLSMRYRTRYEKT
jgi:hypothetical protein